MRPGIIAVFAKPPLPGVAKTRLAESLGSLAAATLARAFLEDTWAALERLDGVRLVLAATSPELAVYGLERAELWLQGEGDLGARMERVARRALELAPWVLLVGTDSPGLPQRAIELARAALDEHDAVLGPAADGGYYLLGLRRAEPGLLEGLPWSAADTLVATAARLETRGYATALGLPWFDVDEPGDLPRLSLELARPDSSAPRTVAALAALGLSS